MAYRSVATHAAIGAVLECSVGGEIAYQLCVAAYAIGLKDMGVLRLDADRFVKILQREALGVPEAVLRLRDVFADEILR